MKKIRNSYWWLLLPVTLLWILFKWAYPFPDFFIDSYSYIGAAAAHDSISFRPIGYSLFLRILQNISTSDTFLVTIQYGLVQTAAFYLFFSLRRWFGMSLPAERLLLIFLLFDPLVFYVSNCVSSDALFTALSVIWMVELIGLAHRPSWKRLIVQTILLALIFTIRYNALYYPVVAAAAFLLCNKKIVFKLVGIAISLLVVVTGTAIIKELTRQQTGTAVFSAFSGWQMANNALNMYPYIPVDTAGLPTPECRQLAGLAQRYFDSAGLALKKKTPSATTAYMWEDNSPLHQYLDLYQENKKLSYFIAWNQVSPAFTKYGYYLVQKHPFAFARYYCWPSAGRFFLPPLEVFAKYNEGKDSIDPVARHWFRYPTNRIAARSATIQTVLLTPVSWLYLFINLVFVVTGFLYFGTRRGNRSLPPGETPGLHRSTAFTSAFKLLIAYFLANAGFCIFAAPNELRYQVVALILIFMGAVCGLDKLKYTAKINL